jgi:hypothetical protein
MEVLRTEGKKEVEFIKGGIKGRQETQKQAADMATANTSRENGI